jgi:uncharacterized membrane protein
MKRRRGQALVMVALSLTVMVGMLALSVDLGVAYLTRKSAQAAADAAALAGAGSAFAVLGSVVYGSCPAGVVCQGLTACGAARSPPTNVDSACLYASQNGFSTGGNGGDQTVMVASNINAAPLAPGVSTNYWVMVQISQNVPQFFGGILNNTDITVTVTSMAAIVQVIGSGSTTATTVALVQ